jgi:hypothetical protein
VVKEELSQAKFYMVKQEFHRRDLEEHKLTTHDTWSDQSMAATGLDGQEGDEHTGTWEGGGTTPTSLTPSGET